MPAFRETDRAAEIAAAALRGEEDVGGEEGEAVRFYEVETSSVITGVRWEAAAGVTKTSWSVRNVLAAKRTLAGKVGSTQVVHRRR